MRVLSKAFGRLKLTLPWVPPDTKVEIHCKNSIGIIQIICLYKEGHHTVQNKGDLDSFIQTKS